jgi:hypothetical protein
MVVYVVLAVMAFIVGGLIIANFLPLRAGPAGAAARGKSHVPAKPRPPAPAPAKKPAPAEPLEWDGPRATPRAAVASAAPVPIGYVAPIAPPAPAPIASAQAPPDDDGEAFVPTHFAGNAVQRKIRDRYISLRFPGVAGSSADLVESERVIKAARLYFEEKKSDRALELLELAIEQSTGDESLRLAQLEIAFLERNVRLYVALAREFQSSHAASSQMDEVSRLGRALAPDEPIFGTAQPERAHAHYGPWPDTPNWIQAPWDLTAEILGSDHHRAMKALMLNTASLDSRKVA